MTVPSSPEQLRADALAIWHAGLDAVRSDRLVSQTLRVEGSRLMVGGEPLDLDSMARIVVVGAGKAGAGMAAAVEEVLGPVLLAQKQVEGWVNVPADCVRPLSRLHLHAARPAAVNEPTAAGVAGTEEILRLVAGLSTADLCLCLLSGGASALLPAPAQGISLADKQAVTRHLSAAGANIRQLNTVRKNLSRIKGGGLARACRAGRLATLIISDVLGDPLDVIGSGPTVEDSSTPDDALAVLDEFRAREAGISPAVFAYLHERRGTRPTPPACAVSNLVIGNNGLAVAAAAREAERLGYTVVSHSATRMEGEAEDIGRRLALEALAALAGLRRDQSKKHCLVSGGEPVVRLAPAAERGLGGRNQQLVLAALEALSARGAEGICLLSGGTDGEDGPTDAAGAVVDDPIIADARQRGLDPADYLRRNDAYHFFEPVGGLLKTGPTHTNVCDVRVATVRR